MELESAIRSVRASATLDDGACAHREKPSGNLNSQRRWRFRLPLHLKQMGNAENCRHRSGWRHVMDQLKTFHSANGILLDDFVERSFQHSYNRQIWREPWVGIFHHPPDLPEWLDPTALPEDILRTPEFRESQPYLRGAIALSHKLGRWLEARLTCPVCVLKHPTEVPELRFSIDAFRAQAQHPLIQVGWYGRNQWAIYQLHAPDSFRKIHLLQDRPWVHDAIARTETLSPFRNRPLHGHVEVITEVDNREYDDLLSRSVVFNEYWDLSASNTIIEAIARGTPLVVNRLDATEEYLGSDYPLLYSDIDEVHALLADEGRVAAAAEYLAHLDKTWLDVERFAGQVGRFIADCVGH